MKSDSEFVLIVFSGHPRDTFNVTCFHPAAAASLAGVAVFRINETRKKNPGCAVCHRIQFLHTFQKNTELLKVIGFYLFAFRWLWAEITLVTSNVTTVSGIILVPRKYPGKFLWRVKILEDPPGCCYHGNYPD